MSAPAWSSQTIAKAKHDRHVLAKVYLQGKHVFEGQPGRGTFGVSFSVSPEDAMALAALINRVIAGTVTPEMREILTNTD